MECGKFCSRGHDIYSAGGFGISLDCPICRFENANTGINPKDLVGAKKLPILSVVPASSILGEAEAMRDGAAKYGPMNWRTQKIQAMTYVDANLRHVFAWVDGEELASDSGVHHLKHAKATLGILIDAIEHDSWVDNRPKGNGATARLLAEADRSAK